MIQYLLISLAITLPTEPPATRTIEYEEQWRTDPYSEEYLMGNVMQATCDDDGNIYFLDNQLQEVYKFDAAGNYVATVARKGEGPGEIDQIWTLSWWGPDALILPRTFPAKVIRVSADGTPLDELHVYRNPGDDTKASVTTLTPMGDHAAVNGSMFQFSADGNRSVQWLGVIDRMGTVVHEFGEKEIELPADPMTRTIDEAAEFWEWGRWAASPDGHVFRVPDREKWLIERYDLEGNLTGTFERDLEPRKRTKEEIEQLKSGYSFIFNGQEVVPTFKLLETVPLIHGLQVVGDQLWVFRSPVPGELPDGVWRRASVLDLGAVFDANVESADAGDLARGIDGLFIGDIDLAVPYDEDLDIIRLLPSGQIMVVENGIAARDSHFASFGAGGDSDEDEDLSDAEPAEIVIYAPKN